MKNRIYLQALYKHCMEFQEQKKIGEGRLVYTEIKIQKKYFNAVLWHKEKKKIFVKTSIS